MVIEAKCFKKCEKKSKKALQIIYFGLWYTRRLFQNHCSFVKGCRKVKSEYQKRGRTDGDSSDYFLRVNTFYIDFKIMFLEVLNKEIKISF